jgi:sec-independent protein translocase protein TatA
MPNLGFTEIMIILVVVLLVFGAKRIPEIGASMGKGIREFQRSIKDTKDAVMRDDGDRSMLDGGRSTEEDKAPAGGEPKRLSQ